jgi:hypothetical protein
MTTETSKMTQTLSEIVYADALFFLTRYFNQFDELELQEHDTLTVQDIVDALGYASFEDQYHPDVAYISDVRVLKRLRDEIQTKFYN